MAAMDMEKPLHYLIAACFFLPLISCGEAYEKGKQRKDAENEAIERARAVSERLRQEQKLLHPYGEDLRIDNLTMDDAKRLCGEDFGKIATGWPMQKARVCFIGPKLRLVSASAGGIRIWQWCSEYGECVTVGETDGRVSTWTIP